jgi:hypothetical protein
MGVYQKMQEILAAGAAQPPEVPPPAPAPEQLPGEAPGASGAAGAGPDPQALAASGSVPEMERYVQSQLGLSPHALMSGLMQRPELAQRIRSSRVQQALADISASPWKVGRPPGGCCGWPGML